MLSGLTFLFPYLLGALIAVPVLWWLLRVMPPRPKTIKFPAFFLLKGLATTLKTAAHTPWWLLLLRCLTVALFIFALAEPMLHPSQELPGGKNGEVLVIVDNGWASASNWNARIDKLRDELRQVQRSGRPVVFLPTAPGEEDSHIHSAGPMEAAQAEEFLSRLKPEPWSTDPENASVEAAKIKKEQKVSYTVFLSDGIAESQSQSQHLLAQVDTVVMDDTVNDPYILRPATDDKTYTLERLNIRATDTPVQIVAYTRANTVADETTITFPGLKKSVDFKWEMLPDVRSKTARITLRLPEMASATFLANAHWKQHPVGVIADTTQQENRNFLSEIYYLRRALEADSQLTLDKPDVLMKMQNAALILPDSTPLTTQEKDDLLTWVQNGGFLIRFAGPRLAAEQDNNDPLLPVQLRSGQRAMEGAMTWEKPVHLGPISAQSPLYGLATTDDTTVTRQVLADPTPDTFEKTWLQLDDGTPLITGAKTGKGTIVLVHTTAGPDWSNFCYSGLFVQSLQRMVSLSNGISNYKAKTTLPPLLLLDGFGKLGAPDGKSIVKPVAPGDSFNASPQTPPGLYGTSEEFSAFNLSDSLAPMQALKDIPARVTAETYQKTDEVDLKSNLLILALLLLLIDTAATLRLRGVMIFLAFMLCAAPAHAEEPVNLVSGLYLAYIETGDQDIDRTSYNGLKGLGDTLTARTTARVNGVVALDPSIDNLAYYPVIYWPMTERQQNLSLTAVNNIQNYLSQGGIILFDTRDRQFGASAQGGSTPGARKLRELTKNLDIPELMETPKDHILTRSFYLLSDFPGRYDGGTLWVEKEPSARHDAITSVIIGSNDWAAAWSKDPEDRARFTIDGGEQQREMAYRFGINLVMIGLTGNYKADQIHTPYIIQRLGQ
jgi:hypothetical protein